MSGRPRLQTLIYEVTPRCNHACLHCYNIWQGGGGVGQPGYDAREATTEEALALLEKVLDETECRHVTLTGGEPLLFSGLPQILDLLRRREVASTLISNGRLLAEHTAVDLLDRGLGLVELPLLSWRREVHDQLSGSPGAFDAVLEAMANLRLHRGPFVAVFVATRLNAADFADTVRLAFAFGAQGLMLNRFNPGGRGRDHLEALQLGVEELRRLLTVANAASAEHEFPIACSVPVPPCLIDPGAFPRLTFGFCAAGTERAYFALDSQGNLRPCNHSPTVLGNVRRQSVAELVNSPALKAYVAAVPPFCAPCRLRTTCRGNCKAAAEVCYGSPTVEEPFLRAHLAEARRKGRQGLKRGAGT